MSGAWGDLNVIATQPRWSLGGVSVFTTHLVRGLHARGARAHVLLTDAVSNEPDPMPAPADIPITPLPIDLTMGWRTRWRVLIDYLESHAPCIYLPNYDLAYSCVSSALSERVVIVGILHGNGPEIYEQIPRLGPYWNAIVTVSQHIAAQAAAMKPDIKPRLHTIPYGVEQPSKLPERPHIPGAPLKIIYAGRLVQREKRVLDMAQIALALAQQQIPFELTLIGSGPEQAALLNACAPLLLDRRVRFLGALAREYALQAFAQSDVFILTSDSEGLPITLLEAMAHGCVPVVTNIPSGIPELVQDGVNGYRVTVGDIETFVERLALLQRGAAWRSQLGAQAYQTVCDSNYRLETMVQRYAALFQRLLWEAEQGLYRRPRHKIIPPPLLQQEASWKNAILTTSLRSLVQTGKSLFNSPRVARQ